MATCPSRARPRPRVSTSWPRAFPLACGRASSWSPSLDCVLWSRRSPRCDGIDWQAGLARRIDGSTFRPNPPGVNWGHEIRPWGLVRDRGPTTRHPMSATLGRRRPQALRIPEAGRPSPKEGIQGSSRLLASPTLGDPCEQPIQAPRREDPPQQPEHVGRGRDRVAGTGPRAL